MIVVTGATGNVGRTLVRLLAEAGEPMTAVSRNITESDMPRGVRAVAADLAEPASLRPALDGADAMFLLISGDFVSTAGDLSGVVGGILSDAKASGVGRIVLLSSQGVVTRPDSSSHGSTGRSIEDAVRRSGMDWTILRPGGFDSNAYAWAEAIGDALGEPIRFVEQTREEARAQMLAFMPEPVVETTLAIIGEPTPAERRISPDIERVLGRAPRTFAAWAHRNADAFR